MGKLVGFLLGITAWVLILIIDILKKLSEWAEKAQLYNWRFRSREEKARMAKEMEG